MQQIECEKCRNIEIVNASNEYRCSICGGDSFMTITQEIQNTLTRLTLEEINKGLIEKTILIGACWNECEWIEQLNDIKWSKDIPEMGITVYGLNN